MNPARTITSAMLLAIGLLLLLSLQYATAQQSQEQNATRAQSGTISVAPDAMDVIFLKSGAKRSGRITGTDGNSVRLSISEGGKTLGTVAIPRDQIERIEFADDPEREEFLRRAEARDVLLAARYWGVGERFLDIAGSPAARVGLRYAELLLESEIQQNRQRAFEIFRQIETRAWSENDRAAARRGRLRALIATGRAGEAVAEARELAERAEDPAVLIEAKYILATVAAKELRDLEEANPRWQEDRFVRPERQRIYNEALDLYLFAPLFYGSDSEAAARGLWGTLEIRRDSGDLTQAADTARDIIAFYPETREARSAEQFLATLPKEILEQDHEKEARETIQ